MSQIQNDVAQVSAVPTIEGAPAEKRPTLTIVEQVAWKYYVQFRQFLRSDYVRALVAIRPENRPLNFEEVSYLVRPEHDPDDHEVRETCVLCGEEFTPVRWMDINNKQFLDFVAEGASIKEAAREAEILIFGAFYLNPEVEVGYGAFCGKPYYFDLKAERYFINNRSCIGMAKENHPKKYWGSDQGGMLDRLEEIANQREEDIRKAEEDRLRRRNGAAAFFGNNSRPKK